MLIVSEAKDSRELKAVSAACSGSDEFLSLLNQASRKLIKRGNFFNTVKKIHTCVNNNCVVWGRSVGTILATNICGRHVPQKDFWYEFLPQTASDWPYASDFRGVPCGGNIAFESAGRTSVFANVPCGRDFYVRAYPSTRADIGKTITIFGIDLNGQVIRTVQNGVLQEGVVLTLAVPYSTTPMAVRRIDRVVKQKTQGVLRLYFFDTIANTLWDCATYDPTETTPDYIFSKFTGARNGGGCPRSIEALVKLEYIPVQSDNDLVLIEDLDSLQLMMLSIRQLTSGNNDKARSLEMDSFREENYGLRNKFPIEQFVCSFNPYGTARLSRVTSGFI